VRVPREDRPGRLQEAETYSTMTRSLLGMADHLRGLGVTRVPIAVTGTHRARRPTHYERAADRTTPVNARVDLGLVVC
jgi:transposase